MTDFDKIGRRGKPQREIYTPGSGPLRKSGKEESDVFFRNVGGNKDNNGSSNSHKSETINKISEQLENIAINSETSEGGLPLGSDNGRRNRKPDCELYVPKPLAEAIANRKREQVSGDFKNDRVFENDAAGRNANKDKSFRRRDRDRKKKGKSGVESGEKYQPRETEEKEVQSAGLRNRFVRHGSEPRTLVEPGRLRDLRSIDTTGWGSHHKPPPGRRGSLSKPAVPKSLPPTFDSLPPRLQKKYMEEKGMEVSYIGSTTEAVGWDGSSVTFQGRLGGRNNLLEWSKTLPPPRGKGRGRYHREPPLYTSLEPLRYSRSLTPEMTQGQFDNATFSPLKSDSFRARRFSIEEKENRVYERVEEDRKGPPPRTEPVYRTEMEPPPSLSSSKDQSKDNSDAENVLDWAAEVERCEQEIPVPLVRCDTFIEPGPPPAKERKKRRKRRIVKDRHDRSISREGLNKNLFRRGSVDNLSNHSRNNSIERNWRERTNPPVGFGDAQRSRKNSSCDNRSRQSSLDRRENCNNNRYSRSRKNSFCGDNLSRSRQNSLERKETSRFYSSIGGSSNSNGRRSRSGREDGGGGRSGGGGGGGREGGGRGKSKEKKKIPKLIEENSWRLEQQILAKERELKDHHQDKEPPTLHQGKPAGILVLPQPLMKEGGPPPPALMWRNCGGGSPPGAGTGGGIGGPHPRRLYDPSNPDRPIMVAPGRGGEYNGGPNTVPTELPNLINANLADQMALARPLWYNPYSENFSASHNQQLIRAIEQADCELHYLLSSCAVIHYWDRMQLLRSFLQDSLKTLLLTDLRFCEVENVEQHLWKILYYNVIELLRKLMVEQPDFKDKYKQAMFTIIQEGSEFYERLLSDLETANKMKLDVYLTTPMCVRDCLRFPVLPLIAAQKIYLSLGDLARYKEQANETCNYGIARQWYMKAHQINPKNGRPYNQLAILALYTKRKLDAVYYYMRCLMSSNPVITARESLISMFDENRKKYEAVDKKRKEERAKREREKMKEKEGGGGIRREIWVHPGGRKNVHRTTSTCKADYDSEDEELYQASSIEVNKRFIMSYLHVHGKIYTKIGQHDDEGNLESRLARIMKSVSLESLTETGMQMLREFRALLQHSPIPLNSSRFLQLFALNMFSIEISQPKGDMVSSEGGCYRSATQEAALVISLQMFNLLLERFNKILEEHRSGTTPDLSEGLILPPDCQAILPALKVWCDWLMTHVEVWNPPPSCQDYKVGPPGDCWTRIATLVNLLEKIDYKGDLLSMEEKPDYELVYLIEDATLSCFTPLMANIHEPVYRHKDTDMELSQMSMRIHKILFFGTVFLCGLDPPVLKLHKVETGLSEYISVVEESSQEQELLLGQSETCSESASESDDSGKATGLEEEEGEVSVLAARRRQLERQERHRLRSLRQKGRIRNALTEMEIRPHELVPDTNCFIECLPQIETVLRVLSHHNHPYLLMVPLVVVNELEGLSRGCKPSQSVHHSALVRETAKSAMALFQKKHPALKTCTTRGTILSSTVFTLEEDSGTEMNNDDKILTTCMNLCRTFNKDEVKEGGRRKLYRDVVLLTEDRNLAVKAMGRDMPVRSLPDFMRWAGLG